MQNSKAHMLRAITAGILQKLLFALVILLLLSSIMFFAWTRVGSIVSGTGTIKYIILEGHYYVIRADNGSSYEPLNLPKEFEVNGLRVDFVFVDSGECNAFHMNGMHEVFILSINKL
jgi:hypothetical protein